MDVGMGAGHNETSASFATEFSFLERDAIEESANSMMSLYSARGGYDIAIAPSTTTISSADEAFVIALVTTKCSVLEDFIAADRSGALDSLTPG